MNKNFRHPAVSKMIAAIGLIFAGTNMCLRANDAEEPTRPEPTLYAVGYAHLDTEWRSDFVTTIDQFIKNRREENFDRFEKFPDNVFNFTGSARYRMMKEYYPENYEELKT